MNNNQKTPAWFTFLAIVVLVLLAAALLPLAKDGLLDFYDQYEQRLEERPQAVPPRQVVVTAVPLPQSPAVEVTRVVTVVEVQTVVVPTPTINANATAVPASSTPKPPKVEFHSNGQTLIESYYYGAVSTAFEETLPGAMTAIAVYDKVAETATAAAEGGQ